MSDHSPSSFAAPGAVPWADPRREAAFGQWLAAVAGPQGLRPETLRIASADASFRRYLRIDAVQGTRIIMDAPPGKEDCRPFVRVAALMAQAGLNVPRVLAWDEAQGFMLLDDLGTQTMIDVVDRENADANRPLYMRAVDALVAWQPRRSPACCRPTTKRCWRASWRCSPTGTWSGTAASRSRAPCARRWTAPSP